MEGREVLEILPHVLLGKNLRQWFHCSLVFHLQWKLDDTGRVEGRVGTCLDLCGNVDEVDTVLDKG